MPHIEVQANALSAGILHELSNSRSIAKLIPDKWNRNGMSISDKLVSGDFKDKMVWTSSAIATFRACPRKFYWKYLQGIRSVRPGPALVVGTAFHQCLAIWYSNKSMTMEKIATRASKELTKYLKENIDYYDEEEREKLETSVATFYGMLMGYATVNNKDRKIWTFDENIGSEREFIVDCGDFYYAGSIDQVFQDADGDTWLMEHKTTSQINQLYVARLVLDFQTRGYYFGGRATIGNIKGVVYNVTAKSKIRRKANESQEDFNQRVVEAYMGDTSKHFYRQKLTYAKRDLAEFIMNLQQTHAQFMAIAKSRPSSVFKSSDYRVWPQNDKECTSFFKLCEYYPICSIGLDKSLIGQFEQVNKMHVELGE